MEKNIKQIFEKLSSRLKIVFDQSDALAQNELTQAHGELLSLKKIIITELRKPQIQEQVMFAPTTKELELERKHEDEIQRYAADDFAVLVFAKVNFKDVISVEMMPSEFKEQQKFMKRLRGKYEDITNIKRL